MTRCVVNFQNGDYANLDANVLSEQDGFTYAYKNNRTGDIAYDSLMCELIGKFKNSEIVSIYLSEKANIKSERKDNK